jgi:tetratricopeptide (TPR) repeat protein
MHNKSFAATIELSLASAMFQELGPDARALLEVVAFFPQGVNQNNLEWLFPTISNGTSLFDKFCVLSLTYRSDSFITMLAPLRDHLCPRDPKSSPLLCMAKEQYFTRMSADLSPNKPGFGESRWIVSEDVNIEHLLDVFTTIDANSDTVWDACADFIGHLVHHKQRLTILKPKIEGLPDDHPSKPAYLFGLSQLFQSVGNHAERKRLLAHTLKLQRERGDDYGVARTLRHLSRASRRMGLREEGIQQLEEASEILERLGDTVGQARCLKDIAGSLSLDRRFDAAEEAASHAIDLLAGKSEEFLVCKLHRLLGNIYRSKGETENAIDHLEVARGIASSFNWDHQLFFVHYDLATLFYDKGELDDAQAHVERAKSYAVNHTYYLGLAMQLQAGLWHKQHKLEEARAEALCAVDVFERLGAAVDLKGCRRLVQQIEEEMRKLVIPDNSTGTGEFV